MTRKQQGRLQSAALAVSLCLVAVGLGTAVMHVLRPDPESAAPVQAVEPFAPVAPALPAARVETKVADGVMFVDAEIENVVAWVSTVTRERFVYSADIKDRRINLCFPKTASQFRVLEIFASVLEANGLVLIDEIHIVSPRIDSAGRFATGPHGVVSALGRSCTHAHGSASADSPASRVIKLRFADPFAVQTALQPLMCHPKGIVVVEELGAVIVTDHAADLDRIAKEIELMDRERIPLAPTK